MPATTRSAKKQPRLEEVKGTETKEKKASETKRKAPPSKDSSSKKRKANDETSSEQTKAHKAAKTGGNEQHGDDGSITINRAPVLELWASCVANFLYPELAWETCLSVGGAISTITAIAKGRSIGTMEKPDPGEAEQRRQQRKEKMVKQELDELDVMSFNLKLKDGAAMVGDKPKKANEVALRKKYGDDAYEKTKDAFEQALSSWKGKETELDHAAFKMYEDFRPSIPPGQKGWGRKGQLNLETVQSIVGAA